MRRNLASATEIGDMNEEKKAQLFAKMREHKNLADRCWDESPRRYMQRSRHMLEAAKCGDKIAGADVSEHSEKSPVKTVLVRATELTMQEKIEIAEVYAQAADCLYRYLIVDNMLEIKRFYNSALILNPDNQEARNIKFSCEFDPFNIKVEVRDATGKS